MELHLCLRLHVRLTPAAKPPPAPAVLPVPASRRLRMDAATLRETFILLRLVVRWKLRGCS
ncbi:diphosphocytidyl methyl erythritol synthase1 [Zea mays]|uniref:Diphosphocytidyl methyl erythritol synthase1 n=1 Tax=Zea mays TaxID=4577 RepID=A0A1D6N5A5_MAIZE|nr:diphosphocytidyl methyl erythritol synthase1 [Zea mays]